MVGAMCRLLAAHLSNGPGPLPEIIDAFMRACAHDELHPRRKSHRDGWGWLVITPTRMIHYRTVEPIDEDSEGFASLTKTISGIREGFVIAHCRRASEGMKKWLLASHPAPHASVAGKYIEVWVAFNGTIPPERLGWSGEAGYVTDTHLIASALAKHVAEKGPREGLVEGLRAVASAAGTAHGAVVAAVAVGGGVAHVAFLNHYPLGKPRLERYYRARIIRLRGAVVAASPTVALYHGGRWVELDEDEIVDLGEMRLKVT